MPTLTILIADTHEATVIFHRAFEGLSMHAVAHLAQALADHLDDELKLHEETHKEGK